MSTPDNSPKCAPVNSISWNELVTSDTAAAEKFYGILFGWKTEPYQGGDKPYTMWKTGDGFFGGMVAKPHPEMPAHWLHYVAVANVDESLAKAVSLGAKVCFGPADIGEAGRIAVLQDPQGAVFGLHQMK
jgi:hypothetical protein